MKRWQLLLITLLFLLSLRSVCSAAPPDSLKIQALVDWETLFNPAGRRSNRSIQIQNYEIPLRLLTKNIADRTPQAMRDAFIFEKDGEQYIRWIINPEDTVHYLEVEEFLRENNVSTKKYKYFTAYKTASRSYIISTPDKRRKFYFSAKVSTDNTGGLWQDKQLKFTRMQQARLVYDYVDEVQKKVPFKNIVILDEPMMVGIEGDINQAMMVRDLGTLAKGKRFYLPGFSILSEPLGTKIAKLNGAKDVAAFWNKHQNEALGRALGELAARTGILHNSPHSQQFLYEFDEKMRPTGRVVLRDFGDESMAYRPFFEAIGREDLLEHWNTGNEGYEDAYLTDLFKVAFSTFNGTPAPKWFTDEVNKVGTELTKDRRPELLNKRIIDITGEKAWAKKYFDAFNNEFTKIIGNSMRTQVTVHDVYSSNPSRDRLYMENLNAFDLNNPDVVSSWVRRLKKEKKLVDSRTIRCILKNLTGG